MTTDKPTPTKCPTCGHWVVWVNVSTHTPKFTSTCLCTLKAAAK